MSEVVRVQRIEDGALGWMQDHAVHPDGDLRMSYAVFWRQYSQWDRDDFGLPEAGFYSAVGHWLPINEPELIGDR